MRCHRFDSSKETFLEWRLQNVPPEMEWILKKALAKDKEERYQTAGTY